MILNYRHDNEHGATLVCQALGYRTGYHYREPGGTGPIFGDKKNILCKGGEATVWDCPTPGKLDCNHGHDAGASCYGTDPDILENNPHTLKIHGVWGSVPGEERVECQPDSYCDREEKKCKSLPSECPAMPSAASKECLCPSAIERCQDCRTDPAPKPSSVELSSEKEAADYCVDSDLTTNCMSDESKEFPSLVLKYAEPITVKQVLVWHNREKFHRAQNLKVFVFPDDGSLADHTLIGVAKENLLGSFDGPPEDTQDYILFGDKCGLGILGSVVVIQRDTLGWGVACPECLVLDLAEVVVKTNVSDNSDSACHSVSTITPKEITMSGTPNGAWVGGYGKNPWLLFEFAQTIEVKEVVLLPIHKLHVKDVKVFVGMDRPVFDQDELFMNDPVCGVYVPPRKREYDNYFKIETSFTFKGNLKVYLNHPFLSQLRVKKPPWSK